MEITQSSENIQSEQQRENGLWGVGMDRASTDCDHNQRSNMYVVSVQRDRVQKSQRGRVRAKKALRERTENKAQIDKSTNTTEHPTLGSGEADGTG